MADINTVGPLNPGPAHLVFLGEFEVVISFEKFGVLSQLGDRDRRMIHHTCSPRKLTGIPCGREKGKRFISIAKEPKVQKLEITCFNR